MAKSGLFILNELHHSINGAEVDDLHILIGDSDAELFLQKGDQLHGKERVDESALENVVGVRKGYVIAEHV